MTLEQAMVGRPRTTCKPSAHHRRQKPAADAPRGRCPDRLTPLRLKRLMGGSCAPTTTSAWGRDTPPLLRRIARRGGRRQSVWLERASVSFGTPALRARRSSGNLAVPDRQDVNWHKRWRLGETSAFDLGRPQTRRRANQAREDNERHKRKEADQRIHPAG